MAEICGCRWAIFVKVILSCIQNQTAFVVLQLGKFLLFFLNPLLNEVCFGLNSCWFLIGYGSYGDLSGRYCSQPWYRRYQCFLIFLRRLRCWIYFDFVSGHWRDTFSQPTSVILWYRWSVGWSKWLGLFYLFQTGSRNVVHVGILLAKGEWLLVVGWILCFLVDVYSPYRCNCVVFDG